MALSQRKAQAEQFESELTVAVHIRQNSPCSKVTVFEDAVNEIPPLMPLHSYVGSIPSAEHVSTSLSLYGPADDVMATGGGHSAYKVVFLLRMFTMTLTLPSYAPLTENWQLSNWH